MMLRNIVALVGLVIVTGSACNCPWDSTVQSSLEYAHDAMSVYVTEEVHLYDLYPQDDEYHRPYYGPPDYAHSDPYHRRNQYYKGSGSYGGGSYGGYPSSYGHPLPYNGPYEHPNAYDPDFPVGKYRVYKGTATYVYKGCTWESNSKILIITDRDRYGCGVELNPKTQYVLFGYSKKVENVPGYSKETALYISECSTNVPALALTPPDEDFLAGVKEPYCPTKKCDKDGDCAHGFYCAAGTCLEHSSCEITADCFNPANDKGIDPLCDKFEYTCSDHTCSAECCDDAQCGESPCSTASCDEEYVKCVDDVCGSCTARFFNVKGEEVCKSKVGAAVCTQDSNCGNEEYCAGGVCQGYGMCQNDEDCYNPSNYLGKDERGLVDRKCVKGQCSYDYCPIEYCSIRPCYDVYCDENYVSCVDDYCDCTPHFFNLAGESVCEASYEYKTYKHNDPYDHKPSEGYSPYHRRTSSYGSPPYYQNEPPQPYYPVAGYQHNDGYYPSEPSYGYNNMNSNGHSYYNHYPDRSPYPSRPEYNGYYPSRPSYEKDIYYPPKSYKDPVAAETNTTRACESDGACSYGEYCGAGTCRSHGTCATDDDCYNLANFLGHGIRGLAFRRCVTGNVCGVSECEPANCPASPCEMLYNACGEEFVTCVDDFCDGCGAKFFNAKGERVCEDVTADDVVIAKYLEAHPYKPSYPTQPSYSDKFYYPSKPGHSPGYPSESSYGDYSYPTYPSRYDPYYPHGPAYGEKPTMSYGEKPTMTYGGVPSHGSGAAVDKYPTKASDPTTSCITETDCTNKEYCAGGFCRTFGTCEVNEDCYNKHNKYGDGERGTMAQVCASGVCQSETCDLAQCSASPCAYATCDEDFEYCVNDYCGACGAKFFDSKGFMICDYEHRV